MKGKELTKTCKYCNNTYIGSIEELREIFVKQPNCEYGLQAMCKRCRNEKYKLQIDTIEALKKQFKKEIDISFKRSEAITKEDRKYLVKSIEDDKLIKLYQLLGLM